MKVCVYAISLNEQAFVERAIESAREADLFVLADTGSTDETVERARRAGELSREQGGVEVVVHSIAITPWRFDDARNAALSLVPKDVDVCISLDVDEVLMPGWRQEIESLWRLGQTTRMRYLFDWGHGIRFKSDKVHARSGYRWVMPCHERLSFDPRLSESWVSTESLLITHLPDHTKSRGQYLGLLELGALENPHDSRSAFYLGREWTFYGQWEKAIAELTRYLAMPARFLAERAYAERLIGDGYMHLGDRDRARYHYERGTEEAPDRRESWYGLAVHCFKVENWPRCYEAATTALSKTEGQGQWPNDPAAWGESLYDLLALSCYYTGRFDEALKWGERAVELSPKDTRLHRNLEWYRKGSTRG